MAERPPGLRPEVWPLRGRPPPEKRASSQRLFSRGKPAGLPPLQPRSPARRFVHTQPARLVPKSRLSTHEGRATRGSAPVMSPKPSPAGGRPEAPVQAGRAAAKCGGGAPSPAPRTATLAGLPGPLGKSARPVRPPRCSPGTARRGSGAAAQGRGRGRGCCWRGRPGSSVRQGRCEPGQPRGGGGPAPELRAAAGAGSVCAAMKRDRRGRFLPAALAARIGSDPPLPAEISRPESVSRTRRGRAAAAAREEKSAPEPKRWASPPSEAAAAPALPGIPRGLTTGFCRLCHGKFSSRSLRNAFGEAPMVSEDSEKQRRLGQAFFADFQRLVGVAVQQDPSLPPFVCKRCHAQFYKCRGILKAFIQKVNVSPAGLPKPRGKNNLAQPSLPLASAGEGEAPCLDLITSSPQCLHQLVRWSHGHAENCPMAPSLQSVLSSKYCGIIRAVWGCEEGHNYIMSTDSDCSTLLVDSALAVQWELKKDSPQHVTGNGVASDSSGAAIPSLQPQHIAARAVAGQQLADSGIALPASSAENLVPESRGLPSLQDPSQEDLLQATCPRLGSPERPSEKLALSAASDERVKDVFSDLSEGESSNEDENHKTAQSSDDSFEPYPEKRMSNNRKAESKDANVEEPKTRKKPGPKPGWKKKIKCEREELPNIYKCPYQGCTAVYRGADGMKKHIKEHHEEVRERPCPHPGCNKVFMIDRYLQRHVKLIHTEVRNYICDECGQTFKQRKHLSVHQMRHSGAKPLQCEICGFQCRQRASLKYHMTKHKAEAELEFACDQCGKRFEKAHNLNVHMSMVHPLTQTQEKAKGGEPEPKAGLDTVESQTIKLELSAQQEPT